MSEHAVVIAGGGPTGLVLAGELALAGVDVVIVERRVTQELDGARAGGLLARTLELFDQRGIAQRFTEHPEATRHPFQMFFHVPLDLSTMPSRHNCTLGLWQSHCEHILAGWVVDELGVTIRRGADVVGFTQDDTGVDVALGDGTTRRAQYLVGCDGGRSAVRKAAGIDFAGLDAQVRWLIAEVALTEQPPVGMLPGGGGVGPVTPGVLDGPYRVVLPTLAGDNDTPSLDDVRAALTEIFGSDFGVHSPTWVSSFTDAFRQAAAYRDRRVFLAGDAAHVHPPQLGQGLQTGVHDAMNLGWKLARVVNGTAPDALLDSYHGERHPVGARVQQIVKAAVAYGTTDERHQALRDVVAELLQHDATGTAMAARLSGLDVRYDLGDGHPLLGRRMPDLDIVTAVGATRVYELLHEARPLLLVFTGGGDAEFDAALWPHARVVSVTSGGTCQVPAIGDVALPPALLVRPDGYVGWCAGTHSAWSPSSSDL